MDNRLPYPELFAAIVNESGAWMNDPEQTKLVPIIQVDWSWPDLDPADRGNVLLTHGGPTDVVGAMGFTIFNLEDSAQARRRPLRTACSRAFPARAPFACPEARTKTKGRPHLETSTWG